MLINACTAIATYASSSHVENEDAVGMLNLRMRHGGPDWVWVISDGMGGHRHGEQASRITVQTFLGRFLLSYFDSDKFLEDWNQYLKTLIADIDTDVYNFGFSGEAFHRDPHRSLMGATMTGALLLDNFLYLVHVGDTRCYLLRDNSLQQLTLDHVTENGEFLTQALGLGDPLLPSTTMIEIQERDMLIFLSDGVYKALERSEIRDIVVGGSNLEHSVERLVARASESPRFHDDASTILVSFDSALGEPER